MTTDVYDEFALLEENATEVGLPWSDPPPVRRVDVEVIGVQKVSSLLWGDGPPRVVFLHGGGQNAHTWDTVILVLGVPALAVDLPGHGHSDRRPDRDYMPWATADAVAPVIRELASDADLVVGMSLGGVTTIRLTATAPELVRQAVIVDVTPSVHLAQTTMTTDQRETTALIKGVDSFATREEMIELTVAAAPNRPASSVRRGVIHNSRQRPDGRWEWLYDRISGPGDFSPLWEHVSTATMPMTLVRGGASAFVRDGDAEEFVRRSPGARVHVVPGAGHSVQSDRPMQLAAILRKTLNLA